MVNFYLYPYPSIVNITKKSIICSIQSFYPKYFLVCQAHLYLSHSNDITNVPSRMPSSA